MREGVFLTLGRYWVSLVLLGLLSTPCWGQGGASIDRIACPSGGEPIPAEQSTNCSTPPSTTASATGSQSEPPRRGLPAPFKSPPFPGSEYLGVPTIGVPDTEKYPLMKALRGSRFGDWLLDNHVKVYGWVDFSSNASTSRRSNLPDAFNIRADRAIELQQVMIRFERIPDTVQTDHPDWGFRFDNLYGLDYRYTTARGIFSDQLLKHNRIYGYDPVMFYGELYLPRLAQGLIVKVGRFILLPGIEAEVSPYNYMFSHSLLYTYFPYTHMGLLTTTKLNKNWTIQLGLVAGSDIALWDSAREWTPITGIRWVSDRNNDAIYFCTITNSGKFSYNNVQMLDAVWTHKFNEDFHTLTEAYYSWQRDVPGFGYADWYGVSNYLVRALSGKAYLSFRNEVWNDATGQRTGFNTLYTTHTLGLIYKPLEWLYFRPEIKYSHSYNRAAYDEGRRHSQWTATWDTVVRF